MSTRDLIFLSYASENIDIVEKIYDGLSRRNLNVWLDKKCLKTGKWKPQIMEAIAHSRYFIFCLSNASLEKTSLEKPGFANQELQTAWEIAKEQSDTEFAIVPVKIEDCDRGDHRLSVNQQYDLFISKEFEKNLDKLAVDLGGKPLTSSDIKDERTQEDKIAYRYLGKATTAYISGAYNLAIDLVEPINEFYPQNSQAWYIRGISHYNLDMNPDALLSFEKAIEIDPDFDDAWENKANVLSNLGKNREARKILKKLIAKFQNQIEDAKVDYYNSVAIWSSIAENDAAFGHYSESMSAYYDNEVTVSHQGYRSRVRDLNEKIKPLQDRIGHLEKKL